MNPKYIDILTKVVAPVIVAAVGAAAKKAWVLISKRKTENQGEQSS